jgi:hypothetical protein
MAAMTTMAREMAEQPEVTGALLEAAVDRHGLRAAIIRL